MKKKIAVFATGWASEILHSYIAGICEGFNQISADVYLFMCFPMLDDSGEYLQGEFNIFELPDLNDFDAAFIFANSIDFATVLQQLNERGDNAGIPVIYTGKDDNIHYFVGADNYSGTRELAEHVISVHNAKDIFFIAGSRENPDSNIRLQAISDVMSKHGLKLPEDKIYYSDWDYKATISFIRDWLGSGKKLPDAFLCANDSLAMIICTELRHYNVRVPEDIIITGFDNEYKSNIYDPSISSVNQHFDKLGLTAANLAISIFNGEKCERTQSIPCEFIPSESCGCMPAADLDSLRREVGRNKFLDSMNQSGFNRALTSMERQINKGRAYEDLKNNFKLVIDTTFNYEGRCFHIVLDPLFKQTTMDASSALRQSGYPEKMDVVFSMDERQTVDIDDFSIKEIVPHIKNKDKNHFFLCSPLHDNGGCMGYVVFGDSMYLLNDTFRIQSYLDNLNNILSKYKQSLSVDFLNRKLLELSETDALTKVKNRTAYQARQEQIDLDIADKTITEFAVMLCDINGLKHINDTYGHEAGDEYIVNSCRLICDVFKRSAIYRIGGDEFAVILIGNDYEMRHELINELKDRMDELKNKDIPICEKISIAGGLADYDPDNDTGVDSVLHRADIRMYQNKQAMKKK